LRYQIVGYQLFSDFLFVEHSAWLFTFSFAEKIK